MRSSFHNIPFPHLFERYHLDKRLVSFPDLLQFLEQTKVTNKIVGFAHAAKSPPFPFDEHKNPLIKMSGALVPWSHVKGFLRYDKDHKQVRDIKGQVWYYLSSMEGFMPFNRTHSNEIVPIHKISEEELRVLRDHAKNFFFHQPEREPEKEKTCILQIITNSNETVSNLGMMLDPPHAWTRVITEDGLVYSFGMQANLDYIKKAPITRFFSTLSAKLPMLDFAEFLNEKKDHMVTSIPITREKADKIFDQVKMYNEAGLRFQYLRQNCTNLSTVFLDNLGYIINIRCHFLTYLWLHFPDAKSFGSKIEKLHSLVKHKLLKKWHRLPSKKQNALKWAIRTIFYLPKKTITFVLNTVLLFLGGTRTSVKLAQGIKEEALGKKKVIQFSTLIRSWKDLFNDEVNIIHHPAKIANWQKEQTSTYIHKANGMPYLSIVPEHESF